MGNIIGIKLADGSFYPVMEEGNPTSRKIELTTVRDSQTTVQLALYRSATGSMEDAEYIDTLEIDNLLPHQKQEHTLNLNISLDENNVLSAKIDDPETGMSTDSKVSLFNLKSEDFSENTFDGIDVATAGVAAAGIIAGAALVDDLSEGDSEEEKEILEDVSLDALDEEFALPEEIDLNIGEESFAEQIALESEIALN